MRFLVKFRFIIILSVVIVLVFSSVVFGQGKRLVSQFEKGDYLSDQVVAIVNDEEIYLTQLQNKIKFQQLARYLIQINPGFTNYMINSEQGHQFLKAYQHYRLEELIDELLLFQAAHSAEIKLSEKEKTEYFTSQLERAKQQDLTEEELIEGIQEENPAAKINDLNDIQDLYLTEIEEQLIVQKYIEKEIGGDLEQQGEREKLLNLLNELRQEADVKINL